MFWRKCGKLISTSPNGGSLINCDECPCPYYGIFVISEYVRMFDPKKSSATLRVDDYCIKRLIPIVTGILNNELTINLDVERSHRVCIPISRSAAMSGQVGSYKETFTSKHYCAEYNSTACVRFYNISVDIRVYRIGKCFDDYDAFAEYFYGPCGVEPDENGEYPAIFSGDPVNGNWTSAAGGCLYSYWMDQAEYLYKPRMTIEAIVYTLDQKVHPYTVKYDEEGEPEYHAMLLETNGNATWYKIGGKWGEDEWGNYTYISPNCCERWSGSSDALLDLNEKINEDKGSKDRFEESTRQYHNITIPHSDYGQCAYITLFAYRDGLDVHGYQYYRRRYGKIKFIKPDGARSDATGVRCIVSMYYQKLNQGEYCTVTNGATPDPQYMYGSSTADAEVTFKFGDTIETNILDNQPDFKIVNDQECDDDCKGENSPDYNWCSCEGRGDDNGNCPHTEEFIVRIAAVDYTFG